MPAVTVPAGAPAHEAGPSSCSEPLPAPEARREAVVIDTNIILDVFVFADAAAKPIRKALEAGELDWIATRPMRDELARVLDYPQIVPRLNFYRLSADDVLASFDRHARLTEVAIKARLNCSDPDDQKFIDLAVAGQTLLLSKDRHVLSMSKRLLAHGVRARAAI
ncbi:MAG: putative toxin-antitoxin system toxin component, PIN family [Burkholderiales bacterium]|nr:putative toxin-antitoxin system toxin component, PIN family [Burkholderiales bacterium]